MEVKRGEIYWVDWSPGRGSEQLGLRPALVIQNDTGNKFSPTTIVAALTTTMEKSYPFLVKCAAAESGFNSFALSRAGQCGFGCDLPTHRGGPNGTLNTM